MSQTLHQIYQSKAIVLARTMVVKFHNIAETINRGLIDDGYYVDENDPTTWKYYMNMAGEYHQADHDRLRALSGNQSEYIQIKVAGDNQPLEVNFTKELLYGEDADLAVANEYRFNTHYYNSLITKYPEFEDLILGVLNPVPKEIALGANDGEILYCGGYLKTYLASGLYHYVRQDYGPISENFLIETNEENLITILQSYIYGFLGRWWNANYAVTNDLFQAYFYGYMMMTIPQILGNIRLGNAKTPMAHSFHIREHLESYGNLGWVAEYLSKGVLLWLYRNMVWLTANRGKMKVFEDIIENVLTPSDIPIDSYKLRHDVSSMGIDKLTPDVFMEKHPLNFNRNKITFTRDEIINVINAEVRYATENYYDQEGQADTVRDQSRYSMFDNLNTRVLESTVIDRSNRMAVTLEDIGLNLWCYTASQGLYKGSVIFTNPLSNERVQLTPLNAYILAFYCFNRGWANVDFEYIPTMYARLIHRHPLISLGANFPVKPRLEDIKKGVLSDFITDTEIKEVLGTFVPDYTHRSSGSFAEEVVRAHKESIRKYFRYAKIEDAKGRAYGEWAAHQCYWFDIPCPLTTTPTKYVDWLTIHGIDFTGFTREDFITLGLEVTQAATGVNLTATDDLRNKQTAALAVLKHFASYTVQIIQNTVASDSFWLDWKTLRVTNDRASAKSRLKAELPMLNVLDHWSISEGPIWLKDERDRIYFKIHETIVQKDKVGATSTLRGYKESTRQRVLLPRMTVVKADIPDIPIPEGAMLFDVYSDHGDEMPTGSGVSIDSSIDGTINLSSEIVVNLSIDQISIKQPLKNIDEMIGVDVTLVQTLLLSPPQELVNETLVTTLNIDQVRMSVPAAPADEQLNVDLTVDAIRLSLSPRESDEQLNTHLTINQIKILPPEE